MALWVIPGETITLYATFKNRRSQLVAQSDPVVRIERVNPVNGQFEVVLNNTQMTEMEPGRYFMVWHTPENIEYGTIIARYFGEIDGIVAEGEDTIQITERVEQRIISNTAGVA